MSRPNGVWWNDADLAAEVKSVERTLSTPRRESSRRQHEKAHGKRASDVEPERLVTADDEVPCLPARVVEKTWDRFPSGYIQAPSLELSQPSRPCTPPNLTRIIQVRHVFSGIAPLASLSEKLVLQLYSFTVVLSSLPVVELCILLIKFIAPLNFRFLTGKRLSGWVRSIPISEGS